MTIMKIMIKFLVLAVLVLTGLVLMVCEAEAFDVLIMSKVLGISCWVLVWKLFNDWKEDL